jgi:hypothetical protein
MEEQIPYRNLDTNWDRIIEQSMKTLAEKCSVYQYIHQQMAFEYQQLHDRLTLAALLLAPLPGFMSALSLNIPTENYPNVLPVLNTCVSFGGAVCMSVLKMLNLKKNIHEHHDRATKYDALNNNIRRQLAISRSHRVPAGEYYEWVGDYFDNLSKESPSISQPAMKKGEQWALSKSYAFIEDSTDIIINSKSSQASVRLHIP